MMGLSFESTGVSNWDFIYLIMFLGLFIMTLKVYFRFFVMLIVSTIKSNFISFRNLEVHIENKPDSKEFSRITFIYDAKKKVE